MRFALCPVRKIEKKEISMVGIGNLRPFRYSETTSSTRLCKFVSPRYHTLRLMHDGTCSFSTAGRVVGSLPLINGEVSLIFCSATVVITVSAEKNKKKSLLCLGMMKTAVNTCRGRQIKKRLDSEFKAPYIRNVDLRSSSVLDKLALHPQTTAGEECEKLYFPPHTQSSTHAIIKMTYVKIPTHNRSLKTS